VGVAVGLAVVGALVGLVVGALVGLAVGLAVSHPFAIQILTFARPSLMPTTVILMSETEKVAPAESLASNDDSAYPEPSPPALTTMTWFPPSSVPELNDVFLL
jgi:ABC-type antimicrobial peptide transport system permease subunit